MSPAEVKSAFRYRTEVQAMMTDPDLTGDVLLLALVMSHGIHSNAEKTGKQLVKWSEIYQITGWEDRDLRQVLSQDFPRYEVKWTKPVCAAPMIRRDGPCGKEPAYSLVFTDYDPETGEGRQVGFCSRHGALQHDVRAHQKQWRINGALVPPDNTGGILRRYFDGDLDSLYRWARPYSKLTDGTGKPAEPPRPTLTLLKGGAT